MRHFVAGSFTAAAVLLFLAGSAGVQAQTAPAGRPTSPAATPAPSPSPSAEPKRLQVKIESYTSAINQQLVGPGTVPPQGAGFALGSPVAPGTPYDMFTRSPLVTGEGIHQAFTLTPTYAVDDKLDFSMTGGYGTVGGSGNVAAYWGDSMMPTLNPHLGMRVVTIPPAFPTHNGGDAVQGSRMSILNGSFSMHDGSGAFNVGWFDPHQTVPFVFAIPPWTNSPAQLMPTLREQLGEASPGADIGIKPQILPLLGYDAWAKVTKNATLELMSASLPASPAAPARTNSASLIVTNGNQIAYTGEIASLTQAGPIAAPVLFGTAATPFASAQGTYWTSTLFGQRMVVAGVGATFPAFDSDLELRGGLSCYAANGAAVGSSNCTTGTYWYGRIHHGFRDFDLGLELFRFSAQYAPAILPYGQLENVWSIAYAPRSWFDNMYQFVDNSRFGSNRQGIRATSNFLVGKVEVRLAGGIYGQIQPYDAAHATIAGFVEPYFTPQLTAAGGTLGTERHFDASLAWHPKFGDIRFDFTNMTMFRAATPGNPSESISMNYPAYVLGVSRQLSSRILGAAGVGRFAVDGSYDNIGPKNADLVENMIFVGAEYRSNATSEYHLQYRMYNVYGSPTTFAGPSPNFHGPQIIFEQIFKT